MSEEDIKFVNGIRKYLKEEKKKYGRNTIFTFEYQRIIEIIDKLEKENEELSESNFHFLEINQKLIEEKPIIKELTGKELNLLEEISKLKKENEEIKEKVKFYKDSFNNVYKEFEELRSENEILERKIKL